jgi:hypothetical protein
MSERDVTTGDDGLTRSLSRSFGDGYDYIFGCVLQQSTAVTRIHTFLQAEPGCSVLLPPCFASVTWAPAGLFFTLHQRPMTSPSGSLVTADRKAVPGCVNTAG